MLTIAGTLVKCDASIKAMLVDIDSKNNNEYIIEELDEEQILAIDKQADILNCGICAFDFQPLELECAPRLALWNHAAPLEEEQAPVTSAPDAIVGTR